MYAFSSICGARRSSPLWFALRCKSLTLHLWCLMHVLSSVVERFVNTDDAIAGDEDEFKELRSTFKWDAMYCQMLNWFDTHARQLKSKIKLQQLWQIIMMLAIGIGIPWRHKIVARCCWKLIISLNFFALYAQCVPYVLRHGAGVIIIFKSWFRSIRVR